MDHGPRFTMHWANVAAITAGALVLVFALLRVERKRLWVVLVFLVAPTLYLLVQWANVSGQWPEVLLAFAAAVAAAGGWWLVYGRKLPAPTSDHIKVWGQESTPKPKPQELQAELQRLREEKARLEEELRRLKGGNGSHGEH
jgi:hypothetical protein